MPKQVRHDGLAYFTLSGVEAEATPSLLANKNRN